MAVKTKLVNTVTGEEILLSDGMRYEDESNWSPIVGFAKRVLSGDLVLELSERISGKPIRMKSLNNYGWLKRKIVNQLKAARDLKGSKYWLYYQSDGEVKKIKVVFDYTQEKPLEAIEVEDRPNTDLESWFMVTLHFLEDGAQQ